LVKFTISEGWRKTLTCALALSLSGARMALASDPLPGDLVAPPPNVNIVLYYNEFSDAGALQPVHGHGYAKDTHISADVQALRYIRTFNIDGMLSGVQVVEPYVSFIGHQTVGVASTPFGPGRASLEHGGGFAQPWFGTFIFPVANPGTGTYLVTGVWLYPPIGSYDKDASLNYSKNLWEGEIEIGARKVLLGDPAGQNLSAELWGEGYFFGSNGSAAYPSPAVSANNIPAIYQEFGVHNPIVAASAIPAKLSEEPEGEIHVYFPYQFFAPTRAQIVPGFYQSFGGKQVYTLANGSKLDSSVRSEESQLRLVLSTYLSPHWQVQLNGEYDIAAHGNSMNRNVELRVAAVF